MTIHRPKCCKELMQQWTLTSNSGRSRHVWHCLHCDKSRELYSHWWRCLWLTVFRNDVIDEMTFPGRWLGTIGSLRSFQCNTITFTVMPFNRIIDGAIRLYQWVRYCHGSKWSRELESSYRRGVRDAEGRERVNVATKIIEALDEERKSSLNDERDLRRTLALAILAAGGKVEITNELLAVDLSKVEIEVHESPLLNHRTMTARVLEGEIVAECNSVIEKYKNALED